MFRIVKESKGWIVEVEQTTNYILFKVYKWVPYVKTSGMDCVWHHSEYKYAEMNLHDRVKKDTIIIRE